MSELPIKGLFYTERGVTRRPFLFIAKITIFVKI